MYPRVARATVEILERLGHEVVFPPNQTCCSQMHVNSGYFDDGYEVIKNHVEAFDSWDWDVAVAPSGSCVAPCVTSRQWSHVAVATKRWL